MPIGVSGTKTIDINLTAIKDKDMDMETEEGITFKYGKAICYSGFRDNQSPDKQIYPTYDQVKEDLLILAGEWQYIRLYDVGEHGRMVLKVIDDLQLPMKVMLGICLGAEQSNPNCSWGADFSEYELQELKESNKAQIEALAELANRYPEIVFSVSAGNEATVEWTDHLVPVESVIGYVQYLKDTVKQPVTFCENYAPWQGKLKELAEVVDFISIHTYPLWEYKHIDNAMAHTIDNYYSVKNLYPNKEIVITEAGWASNSNGRGMPPENANEDIQAIYCDQLMHWSRENHILTFLFEAFDETWKGSEDPLEPEKHWGIYTIHRKAKKVLGTDSQVLMSS